MSDARARFVEAMHEWIERDKSVASYLHVHGWNWSQPKTGLARQAVEAFADAECGDLPNSDWTRDHNHPACRASLLRDCGLADD